MPRLLAGLFRFPDVVAAALLAVLTLLITVQVLVRYALGGSRVWSEELTRLLFVWLILIAATTAPPMRVDLFVDLLSPRWRARLRLFSDLVVFGLTLVLLYGAWGMMDLTQFDTCYSSPSSTSSPRRGNVHGPAGSPALTLALPRMVLGGSALRLPDVAPAGA